MLLFKFFILVTGLSSILTVSAYEESPSLLVGGVGEPRYGDIIKFSHPTSCTKILIGMKQVNSESYQAANGTTVQPQWVSSNLLNISIDVSLSEEAQQQLLPYRISCVDVYYRVSKDLIWQYDIPPPVEKAVGRLCRPSKQEVLQEHPEFDEQEKFLQQPKYKKLLNSFNGQIAFPNPSYNSKVNMYGMQGFHSQHTLLPSTLGSGRLKDMLHTTDSESDEDYQDFVNQYEQTLINQYQQGQQNQLTSFTNQFYGPKNSDSGYAYLTAIALMEIDLSLTDDPEEAKEIYRHSTQHFIPIGQAHTVFRYETSNTNEVDSELSESENLGQGTGVQSVAESDRDTSSKATGGRIERGVQVETDADKKLQIKNKLKFMNDLQRRRIKDHHQQLEKSRIDDLVENKEMAQKYRSKEFTETDHGALTLEMLKSHIRGVSGPGKDLLGKNKESTVSAEDTEVPKGSESDSTQKDLHSHDWDHHTKNYNITFSNSKDYHKNKYYVNTDSHSDSSSSTDSAHQGPPGQIHILDDHLEVYRVSNVLPKDLREMLIREIDHAIEKEGYTKQSKEKYQDDKEMLEYYNVLNRTSVAWNELGNNEHTVILPIAQKVVLPIAKKLFPQYGLWPNSLEDSHHEDFDHNELKDSDGKTKSSWFQSLWKPSKKKNADGSHDCNDAGSSDEASADPNDPTCKDSKFHHRRFYAYSFRYGDYDYDRSLHYFEQQKQRKLKDDPDLTYDFHYDGGEVVFNICLDCEEKPQDGSYMEGSQKHTASNINGGGSYALGGLSALDSSSAAGANSSTSHLAFFRTPSKRAETLKRLRIEKEEEKKLRLEEKEKVRTGKLRPEEAKHLPKSKIGGTKYDAASHSQAFGPGLEPEDPHRILHVPLFRNEAIVYKGSSLHSIERSNIVVSTLENYKPHLGDSPVKGPEYHEHEFDPITGNVVESEFHPHSIENGESEIAYGKRKRLHIDMKEKDLVEIPQYKTLRTGKWRRNLVIRLSSTVVRRSPAESGYSECFAGDEERQERESRKDHYGEL